MAKVSREAAGIFAMRGISFDDEGKAKLHADKVSKKPKCRLSGQDGNVFNLIGVAQRALRKAGMDDKAKEMYERIDAEAQNYDQALMIIGEYVEVS